MKKLFWGFFFIYLNFHLNLNQHSLNILPNFVGYLLLLQGMKQLEEESRFFQSGRPFAVGMAVYEAVLWVGAIFGVTSGGWFGTVLGLISTAVSLYISWLLVQGVLEMENKRGADLLGAQMYSRWKLLLVLQIIGGLLGLMANLANLSVLFVVAGAVVMVTLVAVILYLLCWKRTMDAYEDWQQNGGEAQAAEQSVETPEA